MRACVHDSEEEIVVTTSNANHCSQAVVSQSVDCYTSAVRLGYQVTGLLVTGLSGYLLVTGSLKIKRTVAVGLFYCHVVYGSTVGCWLRVTGWWLADWLVNWSPCHVE